MIFLCEFKFRRIIEKVNLLLYISFIQFLNICFKKTTNKEMAYIYFNFFKF